MMFVLERPIHGNYNMYKKRIRSWIDARIGLRNSGVPVNNRRMSLPHKTPPPFRSEGKQSLPVIPKDLDLWRNPPLARPPRPRSATAASPTTTTTPKHSCNHSPHKTRIPVYA